MEYRAVPLGSEHDRTSFFCGEPSLDRYFQQQVNQDIKRKLTTCFVLLNPYGQIQGFYTLSNGSVPNEQLPEKVKKRLPRAYGHLPTTLLGRLAVDSNFKGQGLGKLLLLDALKRAWDHSELIGSMAVVVDPLHEQAVTFYARYGFIQLDESARMFLPMKTVSQLF